jgi:outer membrane receptor for ferrienterochelin and colicins
VRNNHGKPVPYANIGIAHSSQGTTTGENGTFRIRGLEPDTFTLLISAVGYENKRREVAVQANDTLQLSILLSEAPLLLNEVVVTGTMHEVSLKNSPVKVQLIDQQFLENDLNSNVIDALQNVNGIQQQVNCGVCGTNNIRINGMEGPYTLVLIDGMPIMSNLASVYGLNGIPTSLVDQIEVVKGPNSTLYGTEAMGGVINIRTKSPEDMPLVSVNTSYTSHREWNADISVAPKITKKVQTAFSGNFSYNDQRYDFNGDNFMDVVLNNRLSLFNKWNFQRPDDRAAKVAMRYYAEERLGGTMDFLARHRGTDEVYGEWIQTGRYEVLGTYDIPIAGELIRADFSYNRHEQESYYGTEAYIATQSTWFTNLT